MAKRLSRRKTMRRKNTLRRKTMRRKNIKKRGGVEPIKQFNRNLELKNCESYFSTHNKNADYNLSTYNHIDNITYDKSQVKTFYELKIEAGDKYTTKNLTLNYLVIVTNYFQVIPY